MSDTKRGPLFLRNKIYDNQKLASTEILKVMKNELSGGRESSDLPYRAFLLSAQMQSGKTGVIAQLMKDVYEQLGYDNLWVISGVNLEDLRDQTQQAMPTWNKWDSWSPNIKSPVEVRNNPNNKDLRSSEYFADGVKDAVIVMDECHIGNQNDSVIDKLFDEIGINLADGYKAVLKQLRKRNIFLIMVSATPYNAKYSEGHQAIPPTFKHIALTASADYYGLEEMLKKKRIFNAGRLIVDDKVNLDLLRLIDGVLRDTAKNRKKYVVVRATHGRSEDVSKIISQKYGSKIEVISFDMKNKDKFSQKHLQQRPKKTTIVLVKQFWRVGNVLDTSYVSFLWDTSTGNVDTVSQSFAGRACGYGKRIHAVDIYTNKKAVEDFVLEAKGEAVSGDISLSKNTKILLSPQYIGKKAKLFEVEFKPGAAFDLITSNHALTNCVRNYLESTGLAILKRLKKLDDSKLHLRNSTINKTRNLEANLKLDRPTAGLNNAGVWNPYCVWYEVKNNKTLKLIVVELDQKKTKEAQKSGKLNVSVTGNLFSKD